MSKKMKTGLGKGLGALISGIDTSFVTNSMGDQPAGDDLRLSGANQEFSEVDIHEILLNPYQPRKQFDQAALQELMSSISEHGIIQPITVRKVPSGVELISGERRLRASKNLGLSTIPAYFKDVETDEQMLTIALIENIQRDDLNAIETAVAFKRLIHECGLTQEQVAIKVGKSRSAVTNFLRLIKLPELVQDGIRDNLISMGHARALLSLEAEEKIQSAYGAILKKEMSVRDTEKYIKDFDRINESIRPIRVEKNAELIDAENKLRQHYGTEIKINAKNAKSGTISLEFYSVEDFQRICEQLLAK